MASFSQFRLTVFDPAHVVSQIVCLQSVHYVSLSLIVLALEVLTGSSITLNHLLYYPEVTLDTVLGWSLCFAFVFNAVLCTLYLLYIVQRAKLCFDFTCTLHGFHVLLTAAYSGGFPNTFTWWFLNIVTLLTMSLGGEYLCMQQEMKPIMIGGAKKRLSSGVVELERLSPAAYQMEGAWNKDGKGPSTLDVLFHTDRITVPNGDVAIDHYNRMEEDIALLHSLGATAYRFSVSWARILPLCNGTVMQAGIDFYSRMIDLLLGYGIEPYLTLFHFDLPQACWDGYKGFLDRQIVRDFTNYADVLFANYGSRVRFWLTLNEADANCNMGYQVDWIAPAANMGRGAWATCMYNSMLMHGSAVQLARSKYALYGMKFGMPAIITYFSPVNGDTAGAYKRQWGNVTKAVNPQLTSFSVEDRAIVANTTDFIALNYYSSSGNTPGGFQAGDSWQNVWAHGLRYLSQAIYKYYNMDIHMTELGETQYNYGVFGVEFKAGVIARLLGCRQRQ
ncbi:hypothetical protein HK101_005386 [Irineochytrium annulatum]|nr:hypothetical protein HK101_005386 [Irineochytrium annulatum]